MRCIGSSTVRSARSSGAARLLQCVGDHRFHPGLPRGHLLLTAALHLALVLGDALNEQVGEKDLIPVDHAEQLRSLHHSGSVGTA